MLNIVLVDRCAIRNLSHDAPWESGELGVLIVRRVCSILP